MTPERHHKDTLQRVVLLRALCASHALPCDLSRVLCASLIALTRIDWTRAALARWRDAVEEYDRASVEARHALLERGWALTERTVYDPCLCLEQLDAQYDAREEYGRLLMRWLFLTTTGARFVCERDCFAYALTRMIEARHPVAFIWQAMLAPGTRTAPLYDPFENLVQHLRAKPRWSDNDAQIAITGVQHSAFTQRQGTIDALIAMWGEKRACLVGDDALVRALQAQFVLMRDGGENTDTVKQFII